MNWIFAGLLLDHLDLYFYGRIDVLPDWLGYLLVLWGMKNLCQTLPSFRWARLGPLTAALVSIALFGANVMGYLPDAGWPGAYVRFVDYALTFAVELVFFAALRGAERSLQTELDDAAFLPAVCVTWLFAAGGVVLRLTENGIFGILTTISTALLTVWLFYALRQICKNYRYTKMQQAFDSKRW